LVDGLFAAPGQFYKNSNFAFREKGEATAQVRSWTQKKLRLLEKYVEVYMTIMDAQRRKGRFRRVVYIDAFADPGRYEDESGDQQEYLEGSPFRALKIPTAHYVN
jgi:three-Cys-motif partner protein